MHTNSLAPQSPAHNKFKVGPFDVEHRVTVQHPAGMYRISLAGAYLGSQYSQPDLDDCQRIRAQSLHDRAELQRVAPPPRDLPFGTAAANARRAKRGGLNSQRTARIEQNITERNLDELEDA